MLPSYILLFGFAAAFIVITLALIGFSFFLKSDHYKLIFVGQEKFDPQDRETAAALAESIEKQTLSFRFFYTPVFNTSTHSIELIHIDIGDISINERTLPPEELAVWVERLELVHTFDFLLMHHLLNELALIPEDVLNNLTFSIRLNILGSDSMIRTMGLVHMINDSGFTTTQFIIRLALSEKPLSDFDIKLLGVLSSNGLEIIWDEFGAEKIDLQQLYHLPISGVVFSSQLIRELDDNLKCRQVFTALVQLCRLLSLRIISVRLTVGFQLEQLKAHENILLFGEVVYPSMDRSELIDLIRIELKTPRMGAPLK